MVVLVVVVALVVVAVAAVVVVLPLGFVVVEMNVPSGFPVHQCCSSLQLVGELMN